MTKTLHRYLVVALFMGLFAVKAGAQYDVSKITSITVSGFTGSYANYFNAVYVPIGTYNGVPFFQNFLHVQIISDGNGNWNFGDGVSGGQIYASSNTATTVSQTSFF